MTTKHFLHIISLTILVVFNNYGQTMTDSINNNLWANKNRSIFQTIESGTFSGTTNGYIEIKRDEKNLVLDFQSSETALDIIPDPDEMYDISTKKYVTKTTSGKTALTYESYALANILTITLSGSSYSIGVIDGASDMPISGLSFNYCPDKTVEFLTLYVVNPLELTTTREIMTQKKLSYIEAEKIARKITILPGSTIILAIKK